MIGSRNRATMGNETSKRYAITVPINMAVMYASCSFPLSMSFVISLLCRCWLMSLTIIRGVKVNKITVGIILSTFTKNNKTTGTGIAPAVFSKAKHLPDLTIDTRK